MEDEIINLATFQFDTERLEKNLDSLQSKMFELKKENQEYTEQMKAVQKATQELTKEQLRLIGSNEELSDEYKENEKLLNDLNESEKQLFKNQQNVATAQSRVRQEITATNTQLKAYMTSEGTFNTLLVAGNNALATQINNINDARASNTELLRVRNQLNPSIQEEATLIEQLNERLNENNQFIKENVSQYEQQKINIGNYSESIKTAFADLNLFNGGLTGFISRSQEAGGVSSLLGNSLKSAGAGFAGLTKSALTFLATPVGAVIGALVLVFGLIKNAMDKNVESADKVNSVFRSLSSLFNSLMKVLEPLGTFIIDVLVGAFELLGNAAESAMGIVSAGLDLLGFDDAAESVREFTEETKNSTKQAYELEKAERELENTQKRARLTQLEYQKGAEKLRQIRDDESKSLAERIQANKELGLLLDEQSRKELAIAQQALRVAEMRAQASKKDKEVQDDYVQALTEIADIEERITGQRSEMLANENSLRKEAADAEKKRQDDAIAKQKERTEKMIQAMQTELDFYIASQGERKKSMQDQLEFDREVMRQSLAIAKAEFDAKKLTRREYELAVLEIQNEFAKQQVDATIANANIEFEIFKLNNQRKLDENKFFTEELLAQEKQRINDIAEAEAAQQTLSFQNGLINAEEYGLAIRKIDENQRIANEEADKTREQAKKDQQAIDLQIQDELNAEAFETSLALQMERYEREYSERKAIAVKNGADMVAFEQLEARKREQIERDVTNNKLQLNSMALGNIATLLGQSSKAGKAFAIAQTTIDTYLGAQKAYISQLIPGDPTSFLRAGLAAGSAVATGLVNVQKIVGTKEATVQKVPGYAIGGKIVNGMPISRANGDNVLITARMGEAILNDQQQRAIGTANLANAGVPGFSASGSAFVQNELSSSVNTEAMAEMIADAVQLGAERGTASGSERGLTNLSDNRQIMENAKF